MIGLKSSARASAMRILTILGIAAVVAATAYGPGNIARAIGYHELPPPPAPESIGYIPSGTPIKIQAPRARIAGFQKVIPRSPVLLADGSMSPATTVYLRVNKIELDDVTISSTRPDHNFVIKNFNGTDESNAAVVGNDDPGTAVELWIDVKSLALCVTADTFFALAVGYAGVFGGRLDELLALIADTFRPTAESALGGFGPCLQINALLPLVGVFIDYGVPLPASLPAANLDLTAATAKITTGPGRPSVTAPLGIVGVTR
jgi:hypothetical protein